MWISWKHQDSDFTEPLTFEQKVDVFYEQTLGWQLHIADLLANGGTAFGEGGNRTGQAATAIRHNGFAVLHICLSYLELVGSLVSRKARGSRAKFAAGFRHVFPSLVNDSPESSAFLKRLFEGARGGIYHEGRTRPGVGLGFPEDGGPIAYDAETICISPERLPVALKEHLQRLRDELLDPAKSDLQQRFRDWFDASFADSNRPPVVRSGLHRRAEAASKLHL